MILSDTGFWLALANPKDVYHEKSKRAAAEFATEGFVTTWPVLTEAAYLISKRLGGEAMLLFLKHVQAGSCAVHPPPEQGLQRAYSLMLKYRDLPMDLADASLVMLAEELDEGRILSTDQRDFKAYRWKNTKPFHNLLLT